MAPPFFGIVANNCELGINNPNFSGRTAPRASAPATSAAPADKDVEDGGSNTWIIIVAIVAAVAVVAAVVVVIILKKKKA